LRFYVKTFEPLESTISNANSIFGDIRTCIIWRRWGSDWRWSR